MDNTSKQSAPSLHQYRWESASFNHLLNPDDLSARSQNPELNMYQEEELREYAEHLQREILKQQKLNKQQAKIKQVLREQSRAKLPTIKVNKPNVDESLQIWGEESSFSVVKPKDFIKRNIRSLHTENPDEDSSPTLKDKLLSLKHQGSPGLRSISPLDLNSGLPKSLLNNSSRLGSSSRKSPFGGDSKFHHMAKDISGIKAHDRLSSPKKKKNLVEWEREKLDYQRNKIKNIIGNNPFRVRNYVQGDELNNNLIPQKLLKRKEVLFDNDEDFIEHFLIEKRKEEEEKKRKDRLAKLRKAKAKLKLLGGKGKGILNRKFRSKSPVSSSGANSENNEQMEVINKAKEKSNQIKEQLQKLILQRQKQQEENKKKAKEEEERQKLEEEEKRKQEHKEIKEELRALGLKGKKFIKMFKQMAGSNPESSVEPSFDEEEEDSEEETRDLDEGPEEKIFGEFNTEIENARQMQIVQRVLAKRQQLSPAPSSQMVSNPSFANISQHMMAKHDASTQQLYRPDQLKSPGFERLIQDPSAQRLEANPSGFISKLLRGPASKFARKQMIQVRSNHLENSPIYQGIQSLTVTKQYLKSKRNRSRRQSSIFKTNQVDLDPSSFIHRKQTTIQPQPPQGQVFRSPPNGMQPSDPISQEKALVIEMKSPLTIQKISTNQSPSPEGIFGIHQTQQTSFRATKISRIVSPQGRDLKSGDYDLQTEQYSAGMQSPNHMMSKLNKTSAVSKTLSQHKTSQKQSATKQNNISFPMSGQKSPEISPSGISLHISPKQSATVLRTGRSDASDHQSRDLAPSEGSKSDNRSSVLKEGKTPKTPIDNASSARHITENDRLSQNSPVQDFKASQEEV